MSGKNRKQNFPNGLLTSFAKMTQLEKIAAGGFGDVYKAEHSDWGTVAYKKLPQSFIQPNDRAVIGMVQEVDILRKLRHPNIVTITGVVFEDHNYGIVLEFMTHGNADIFLVNFEVPMSWKVRLVYDIVLGMNYLHTLSPPIIHGDLKIQNILVTDGYKAKISDFGLSSWKGMSKSSSCRTDITGTVTHISPERWKDANRPRTEMEDIYAFGVLVWEMLTEKKPFHNLSDGSAIRTAVSNGQRPDVNLLPDDTPSIIQSTIETSWTMDPDNRKSFIDIKVDLDGYVSSHEDEIKRAKCDIQRQESSSNLSIQMDTIFPVSVPTNPSLPIQRRNTNTCTESAPTTNQQQTTQVIAVNPVPGSSIADSDVLVKHPVNVLDPSFTEPGQSRNHPTDPTPTSLTSADIFPSFCLNNNHRSNISEGSECRVVCPIQESKGSASLTQTALTYEPNVPQGRGLISLRTNSQKLTSSMPGETNGSETQIKELASELPTPHRASTGVDRDSIYARNLISIRSDPPSRVGGGGIDCVDLRSQGHSTHGEDLGRCGSVDFGRENLRTILNRPRSVPEADATVSPPGQENQLQEKSLRSTDRPKSPPHSQQRQSQDSRNVFPNGDLMNRNKTTEFNNLDANKGYYPKDGGSFKDHAAQMPTSAFPNLVCPTGQSRDETPSCGRFPDQPPRRNCANCDGSGRPKTSNIPPHREPHGGHSDIFNSCGSNITWEKDGEKVTFCNAGSIGPYVQFGNNNTMHIATSIHPSHSSSSSSFFGAQPSPSARSKGPTRKEKIIVPDILVDRDIIIMVADNIGRDWTHLARELGVEDSDIDRYAVDYHVHGVQEIAYQMLRDWIERKAAEAKLQLLAEALVVIKRPDVALKLSSSALSAKRQ